MNQRTFISILFFTFLFPFTINGENEDTDRIVLCAQDIANNIKSLSLSLSKRTSFVDCLFEEDYFVFFSYLENEEKIRGIALGDFNKDKKLIQFILDGEKVTLHTISSKRLHKVYPTLVSTFETSIPKLKEHLRGGFYIDYIQCCERWNYLSYTNKKHNPIKKYSFLCYERSYSSYVYTDSYPNIIEQLNFYGIILASEPYLYKKAQTSIINLE